MQISLQVRDARLDAPDDGAMRRSPQKTPRKQMVFMVPQRRLGLAGRPKRGEHLQRRPAGVVTIDPRVGVGTYFLNITGQSLKALSSDIRALRLLSDTT